MFIAAHISALLATGLSATTLFRAAEALPLQSSKGPSSDASRYKVARLDLYKSLQIRAPCVDNRNPSVTSTWSTTTTTLTWVPAPTHHQESPKTCTPTFQGAAVKVSPAGKDSSWCVPAESGKGPDVGAKLESLNGSGTTFRIEHTGRAEMEFLIKLGGIGNNSVILGPSGDGIGLWDISAASGHTFKIACESCFYGNITTGTEELASGCAIMACSTGMYVTEANGTICMLEDSTGASSSASGVQLFDIVAHDKSRQVNPHRNDECDQAECYEHEEEEYDTHSTDEGCPECEETDAELMIVDSPSCAEDPECPDHGH